MDYEVLLFESGISRCFGFLICADATAPEFQGTTAWFPTRAIPVKIIRTANDGRIGLCHPTRNALMSAASDSVTDVPGTIFINRELMHDWETFRTEPVSSWALPSPVQINLADELNSIVGFVRAPALVVDLLEDQSRPSKQMLDPILSSMSERDLSHIASELLRRPKALSKLAEIYLEDIWAAKALPTLATWINCRDNPPAHKQVATDLDGLSAWGADGSYVSIGHKLNGAARRLVSPRKQICLLASARNEGIYLIEWIAYHRLIGVDTIVIYSNSNSDHSDKLLTELASAGLIIWITNNVAPETRAQAKAYGHAFSFGTELLEHQWALTIDLDEFFTFDHCRYKSIKDFISHQEIYDVDSISLQWLIFGSAGQTTLGPQGVTQRFKNRLPYVDKHVKSLCRPHLFMHSKPHVPVCDSRTAPIVRSANGDVLAHRLGGHIPSLSEQPKADAAWINHYYFKSVDEMLWKWSRNRGGQAVLGRDVIISIPESIGEMFLKQHSTYENILDKRIEACAPELEAEMDRMLRIPGIAEADAAVRLAFDQRLESLKVAFAEALRHQPKASVTSQVADLLEASLHTSDAD